MVCFPNLPQYGARKAETPILKTENLKGREKITMEKIKLLFVRLTNNEEGQDMVEYLLAGFIAVAAGAILPTVSADISTIFSKMQSVVADSANT